MSEAKVLTAKQQRKTISNNKKKKKAPLRNVYGHPRKQFWPVVSTEDGNIIFNYLRKAFPPKRTDKDSTKTNVSSVRDSASSSDDIPTFQGKDTIRSHIVVGLREVIAAIENEKLKCLLLANEVDPPSLGHVIGNLAITNNIPFVAISNLKSVVEELLGFKSWCLGFRVSSKLFDHLCEKVQSIAKNSHETDSEDEASLNFEDHEHSRNEDKPIRKDVNVRELHLYRSDKSRRVFVPQSASSQENSGNSFLSFSNYATNSTTDSKEICVKYYDKSENPQKLSANSSKPNKSLRYFDKVQFLPLQVKRFQENPNKQKWKKAKNRADQESK